MARLVRDDRDTLPDTVRPVNYGVSIYDIELGGAFSYQGTVTITASILSGIQVITLNAHQLKILDSEVFVSQSLVTKCSNVSYDGQKQRTTLEFPEVIPVSNDAMIVIKFQGTINNEMAGFYRSKYKPVDPPVASVPKDGEYHCMFSTQFESSDARKAFPCFDEPNLKATFDITIELPEDQVALSNMPEKSTRKGRDGFKVVEFERTPIMSTYLVAWAIGDFEYVEDFTKRKYNGKNLPVRVYTTKGLKEQARFALEHAHQIIDYFSEIFKIDYPLPKADLLAVHEFSHGAMENWGLVTYRTTAVLFDEKSSDSKYKNRVAYIVAHELAHQWFGNLVTMDWWSELWLNEGFATWVGWLAIDHLHPDWNIWPQFVSDSMQTAFGLDALRGSHPIEVQVKDALEVEQVFDAISYLKGSSVIRMLAAHLGIETFLKGVSIYLKGHAYGNATTYDLWSGLSEASGQDVNALMDPWIRRIGYPVITVTEELDQITVKQSRFLSTGDVKVEDDETVWWVPLRMKGKLNMEEIVPLNLATKQDTVVGVDKAFYKINVDNTGFYRTSYPPARLQKFRSHIDRLSFSDKIGLISDAGALAFSGDGTTSALLGFLEGFDSEKSYLVWSQIISSLGTIKSIFSGDVIIRDALKKFTVKLINSTVAKLGWDFQPGEDYLTGQLRALLICSAGMNGNEDIITEAKRQFKLYTAGDKTAIHPSLRTAVFRISIHYGGKVEYDALKREWATTSSIDGKEIALRAMGEIQDTLTLFPDFLSFLFSSVAVQDVHTGAAALAMNSKTRSGLWQFIKENWGTVRHRLSGATVILDRFLKVSLQKFTDLETEKDISEFFKDKDNRGYDRTLGVISDTIRGRAGYKIRDHDNVLEWLKVNGYA